MSLLIDALKKDRQESTSVTQPLESSMAARAPMSTAKKAVFISLIMVIVILSTAIISFLLFKYFEKEHMTETMQNDTTQMQKENVNPMPETASVTSFSAAAEIMPPTIETPVVAPPPADTSVNNQMPVISDNDNSAEGEMSDDDNANSTTIQKVDIQVVPNQMGANNPIYQEALNDMKNNRYSHALSLLENNDDLLLKTQGLSALLLARIYLSTGQYAMANDVLDRALKLHAGSDVELTGLKAQVCFMQGKYQEAVDILSSQSPDLSVSPEYYTLLADAYMHLNQPNNAVSVFEQIVARFPDSANYWLGLAVAYQKAGDANSALVAYHRAAQLSSNDPQVMLFINGQIEALQAK